MKTNLLGLDAAGLAGFFAGLGEKPFRARQMLRWIHQRGEGDFARMSDLARGLRDKLGAEACVEAPRIVGDTLAEDGTRKWLLKVDGANAVEAVFIPETRRATLCISSQAGCTLDCAFCSTGKQGFNRNLTTAEIVGQLWLASRLVDARISSRIGYLRLIGTMRLRNASSAACRDTASATGHSSASRSIPGITPDVETVTRRRERP